MSAPLAGVVVVSLEQAIADGHLVKPVPISVPLKFQREGIKYSDLTDDEKEQWDSLDWNEEGTVPDEVDPAELNQWLFNIDTVDKALEPLPLICNRSTSIDT